MTAETRTRWREFLCPRVTPRFFLRVAILATVVFTVGRFLLQPVVVWGESMEPTYASRGFNFRVAFAYWFTAPKRGDIVILQYEGRRRMLLKRVLAFAGETVEFRNGVCLVDGKALSEPYVKENAQWTLSPRKVASGHIYVMGDNRGVPPEMHVGGEIACSRILGRPLW